MTNLVWSIVLAVIGVVGIWRAGSKRWDGWALGFAAQLLWLTFALVTHQYGFILSALAYGFVYGRNLWRWRHPRLDPPPADPPCDRPPRGWYCTLPLGHQGSCPARRVR